MKKKLYIILPILFLSISIFLLYQTHSARNEHRLESEASSSAELSAFEQLQKALNKNLTDLGEGFIQYVHFEDVNEATIVTDNDEIIFPIALIDRETNKFKLEKLISSPDSFFIGDTFGLATDDQTNYYYYPLETD